MQGPKFDITLKTYLQIVSTSKNFKSKIIYALHCIHNCLLPTTPSLIHNQEYLTPRLPDLIPLIKLYPECSLLEVLASILNKMRSSQTDPILFSYMSLVSQNQIDGDLTDGFIQQYQQIGRRLSLNEQYTKPVIQIMIQFITKYNLSPPQTDIILSLLFDWIDDNTHLLPLSVCYKLSQSSTLQIKDVLKIFERTVMATRASEIDKWEGIRILENLSKKNWFEESTKYYSSIIFLQLGCQKQNGNIFFNLFSGRSTKQENFPLEQNIHKLLQDSSAIIRHFPYIIDYLHKQSHKNIKLGRIEEKGRKEQKGKICLVKRIFDEYSGEVNEDEIKEDIPLSFVRSEKIKLEKVKISQNCFDVVEVFKYLDSKKVTDENKHAEILLLLLKIALTNKNDKLLWQSSFLIRQSLSPSFGSKYITVLPILQQKFDTSKSGKVSEALNNEDSSLSQKFYLLKWLVEVKQEQLIKDFFNYILRIVDREVKVFEQLYFYLSSETETEKKLWIVSEFREEIEKIFEKVLANLSKKNPQYCIKLVFQFHKLNLINEWQSIYKWALNPLQQLNPDPDLLVDFFQVFEVIVEEVPSVPSEIKKKFFKYICHNWGGYTHEHMFAIERIINCLRNEAFLQEGDQPEEQELIELSLKNIEENYGGQENKVYRKGFELMFSNEDDELEETVEGLIEDSLRNQCSDHKLVYCQHLILWRFQYSDIILPKSMSEVGFKSLCNFERVNNFQVLKNWFQIIATLAHEENILLVPISSILREMCHDKKIIRNSTEIVNNIIDVSVKSLNKYKLQPIIQIFLAKLTIADNSLAEEIISFLDSVCFSNESPYYKCIKENQHIIEEIVRSQYTVSSTPYRSKTIEFALDLLYEVGDERNLVSFPLYMFHILYKYFEEEQIVKKCLQYFKKHSHYLSKALLIRVKDFHCKNTEIQGICDERLKAFSQIQPQKKVEQKKIVYQAEKTQQKSKPVTSSKPQSPKKAIFIKPLQVSQQKQTILEEPQRNPVSFKISSIKTPKQEEGGKIEVIEIQQKKSPKKDRPIELSKISSVEDSFPEEESIKRNDELIEELRMLDGDEKQTTVVAIEPISVDLPTTTFDLTTIKKHIQFIDSLKTKVTGEQNEKLLKSLAYLTETVTAHFYYCKKVIGLGIVPKLLEVNKINGEKYSSPMLKFFKEIAIRKQKNLSFFDDEKSIDFLKKILKQSIIERKSKVSNLDVLTIMNNTKNSMKFYYKHGLLSMLVELAKNDLNTSEILTFFVSMDMHINLIHEIYQRGLLNKMQEEIKNLEVKSEKEEKLLCLWIKLAGKICVNSKIREKIFASQIHEDIYRRMNQMKERGKLINVVFFFASWCYTYEKGCEWCEKEKIPERFLEELSNQNDEEYYRFFHYFCLNNPVSVGHLLRIKYFNHLIEELKEKQMRNHKKHFYKSFKAIINENNYKIILKEKLISKLIQHYQDNNEESIYACIHKVVLVLENYDEFKEMERQGFWRSLELFDYKLKDDGVYPHLLKIYIHLLTKYGITKSIDNPYLAIKVIRKGVFSINLQGKRLTIQYIILLSELEKLYYGRPRCLQILQSIMRYELGEEEINLCERLLLVKQYPSALAKFEKGDEFSKPILTPKIQNKEAILGIVEIICGKYKQIAQGQEKGMEYKLIKILALLCYKEQAAIAINSELHQFLLHYLEKCNQTEGKLMDEYLNLMNQLNENNVVRASYLSEGQRLYLSLNGFLHFLQKQKNIELTTKGSVLLKKLSEGKGDVNEWVKLVSKVEKSPILRENKQMLEWCQQIHQESKFGHVVQKNQEKMKEGVKVKMYKVDGSVSELLLFFTDDFMELNCATAKGQTVKNKWKLHLKDLYEIETYSTNDALFQKTVFGESEGLFSKAPAPEVCISLMGKVNSFYVCFENKNEKCEWRQFFQWGKYNSGKVFSSIK